MKRLGHLVAAAGLAACTSAPVHYHTLLAPATQTPSAGPPAAFLIDVLPVGIPAPIDQQQLVVRQGTGNVAVLDGERWAGPLADELRAALSVQLAHGLATRDVAGLARPGGPVVRIKVQVRRFELWPGQRAQIDADWSLGSADDADHARLACGASVEVPAPGGYPELVQAQQRAIAHLAGRIGADARAWSLSHGATCSNPTME